MNRRRTTLGALNSHNVQSRRSTGYNGKSRSNNNNMTSRRSSSQSFRDQNRASFGGPSSSRPSIGRENMNTRRQTIASGHNSTSTAYHHMRAGGVNDPRPIGERKYQHECIRELLKFLNEHNYDHPISQKILTNPTGKDFKQIVLFLFQMVDKNFKSFETKMVDEVPQVFKGLGYPFGISKTALSAVGSPHTWPALLAALNWLTELLDYDNIASTIIAEKERRAANLERKHDTDADEHADDDLDTQGETMFFQYLTSAYSSFLNGDDDTYQELEEELVANFEEKNRHIEEEINELGDQNESMQRELQALQGAKSEIPRLKATLSDYSSDLMKFDKLIMQLDAHIRGLNSKKEDKESEFTVVQRELADAEEKRKQLVSKLAAQDLSAADVKRMTSDKQRLQDSILSAANSKKELNEALEALGKKLHVAMESVSKAAGQYAKNAGQLKLLPGGLNATQLCPDVSLAIKVKPLAELMNHQRREDTQTLEISSQIFSHSGGFDHITDNIAPTIKAILQDFQVKLSEAKAEKAELQQKIQESDDTLAEKRDEVALLENRVRKSEELLKREKEAIERSVQSKYDGMEKYEQMIQEMQSKPNDGGESSDRELRQTAAAIKAKEEALRRRNEELEEEIITAITQLSEHKAWIRKKLEHVKQFHLDSLQRITEAKN